MSRIKSFKNKADYLIKIMTKDFKLNSGNHAKGCFRGRGEAREGKGRAETMASPWKLDRA